MRDVADAFAAVKARVTSRTADRVARTAHLQLLIRRVELHADTLLFDSFIHGCRVEEVNVVTPRSVPHEDGKTPNTITAAVNGAKVMPRVAVKVVRSRAWTSSIGVSKVTWYLQNVKALTEAKA